MTISKSNYYLKNKSKWKKYDKTHREKHPERIKQHILEQAPRRITFKGRRILLKENPRKGICSNCGKSVAKGEIKQTNMHHTKYHYDDPLKDTIELCVKCHNVETRKEKQQKIIKEFSRKIDLVVYP